jgi:hypothetical protein
MIPIVSGILAAATSKSVIGKIVAAVVIHKLTKGKK